MATMNPDNEKELYAWANGLYEEGIERRRPHEAVWWENLATYAGDLWVEYNTSEKKLEEPNKSNHKVRLPVNLAQAAVRTEYAKLLKNRPIVDVMARSSNKDDINAAEIGTKMLNDYAEDWFSMPKVRRRMLQWALVCGSGALFCDYDPNCEGEVEVVTGPGGEPLLDPASIKAVKRHHANLGTEPAVIRVPQGDMRPMALSPFEFVFDFSKSTVEESMWVIVTEVYDVDEVYRRWHVEVDGDDNVDPGVIEGRMMSKMSMGTSQLFTGGSTSKTQEMCKIHRLFVKPGHRHFPHGCEIVFDDNKIIDQTEFPFTHGQLPVSTMGHIFSPMGQHPMSVIQQIRPVVLELSKTVSQMIENRNMMGNPPWIEYEQNKIEGEIQNKPGMRLKIWYMPNVPEPHPIQMPEIPQYIKELVPMMKETILELSGQNETSQGQVPAGARSGVAIAYLTEENDTKLGPTVQEYEECTERFSYQLLLGFAQYYDTPRTIRLTGKRSSEPDVFDFVGNMLEGTAGVKVQSGSSLPRSLAAKQQYTLDLYDRGLIRDPRRVLNILELGEGEVEEYERDMDHAERETRKMQLGEPVEVKEWHNHQAHLYIIHDFMKTPDYENLKPDIQQLFDDHEEEHRNFMQAQQQAQAQLQQGAAPGGNGPAGTANGQNQPGGAQGAFSSPDDIGAVAESAEGPAGGSADPQDYPAQ